MVTEKAMNYNKQNKKKTKTFELIVVSEWAIVLVRSGWKTCTQNYVSIRAAEEPADLLFAHLEIVFILAKWEWKKRN